jgi:hypothetical protein
MFQIKLPTLALVSAGLSTGAALGQYADAVVDYQPGALSGSFTNFTLAASALGEPSRVTPGPFGGPVDPFSPPYLNSQVVSIGDSGWLTLRLGAPIQNSSAHPFGIDFLIFGNAGFVITNGDFSGGGITDGSLFGPNTGLSRVSVSLDSVNWFALDPALAPLVDGLYPTDGNGDFSIPVNPALSEADFAGKDLAGIRALYGGAGGGAGFDLAWARDTNGAPVNLPSVNFVRVEMQGGHAEIDGIVAVPEPGVGVLFLAGAAAVAWAGPRRCRRRGK